MSSNNANDILAQKEQTYKPDVIVIGRSGRIHGQENLKDYRKNSDIEEKQKLSKVSKFISKPKTITSNIFADISEINEISKSELAEEIIDPDIQYFLAFCSFLYLVRALYMLYRVSEEFAKSKMIYDLDYELVILLVDVFFVVVLFSTALNGVLFCWKMDLSFAFPYLMSLFFGTSLMGFRIIAPIIDNEYKLKRDIKTTFSLNIFKDDRITAVVIDSAFLLLNLSISFCTITLYEQICRTDRALNYEPDSLLIDGNSYYRTKFEDRIFYQLNKNKSRNQNIHKSIENTT